MGVAALMVCILAGCSQQQLNGMLKSMAKMFTPPSPAKQATMAKADKMMQDGNSMIQKAATMPPNARVNGMNRNQMTSIGATMIQQATLLKQKASKM